MKLRILDSGLEGGPAKQYTSSYLVNDVLAVDAGCLGFWRTPEDQSAIRHVLITHSHMDHVASLPSFLENSYHPNLETVTVYGLPETLGALQKHLFNDVIWPDFARIKINGKSLLRWQSIVPNEPFITNGLEVTAVRVNHIVPTCGFIVTDQRSTLIFGGDSGPSQIWDTVNAFPRPRTVVLEASFPNAMHELALASGHLTPQMFCQEVEKMPTIDRIIAVHIKEAFRPQIEQELAALYLENLSIGMAHREYEDL